MLRIVPRDASEALPAVRLTNDGCCTAKQLVAAAVVLSAVAVAALCADLPVAGLFREHELPGELRRLVRLAEVFAWGGTVALIIAACAVLDPRGWRIVPRLVVCAFGAGIVADGIKLFVARLRPSAASGAESAIATFVDAFPLAASKTGHAFQSFPSGHAATAVGLAIALTALYPRGRWLFALFAGLAMFQRIEAQAHYCSDVLAGAAIGCAVGAIWQCSAHGCCGQVAEVR